MSKKVLFVDDEPNVLQSIKRNLRKEFDISTADGGQAALDLIESDGPFAVIVSDMKMPGMNGAKFLSLSKSVAPDSVRMMLTGNADQETAIAAVNEGDVFRFLNKPCEPADLIAAVKAALLQHRMVTAERDLLENTLRGSIGALAEVLSLTNPELFGRTTRFKNLMGKLAQQLEVGDVWRLESVALLSQIGCVTVPTEIVKKRASGEALLADELNEYYKHTHVGADLIAAIPRMEGIAECIRYQEKNFDGSGHPADDRAGYDIPLGARLLRIILDFEACESQLGASKALLNLKQHALLYEPAALAAFEKVLEKESSMCAGIVKLSALDDSMILASDVMTIGSVLLVSKGQQTTASVRRHLRNFFDKNLISDSVEVLQDNLN